MWKEKKLIVPQYTREEIEVMIRQHIPMNPIFNIPPEMRAVLFDRMREQFKDEPKPYKP